MTAETETHVRLATLRLLNRVVADLNATRDLKDTLQAVVDGVVSGLGFGVAAVNLVRSDADLEVAAVAGNDDLRKAIAGQIGSREGWDRILAAAEPWGPLRFLGHRTGLSDVGDVPSWIPDVPVGDDPEAWHPRDALLAPLHTPEGELVGVLSVDLPVDGLRPAPWRREVLGMFAAQAAIAVDNARLRSEMLRAVARLEREQLALRASEESFRQAFEYAPSGMVMTGVRGHEQGQLLRANDALCRMLGYPAPVLKRLGLGALAHPEDRPLLGGHLGGTVPVAGCTELRLARSDGTYRWVSLRTSQVADGLGDLRFGLTHVEDIEDRKQREQALVHEASHDPLTGLPNGRELRARLAARFGLVAGVSARAAGASVPSVDGRAPYADEWAVPAGQILSVPEGAVVVVDDPPPMERRGVALLFCDLDGFKHINDNFGHHIGDVVLKAVAERLTAAVREGDTVARLGGDEFVVLADGIGREEAEEMAVRLRRALSLPIPAEGLAVPLEGASFGIGWAEEAAEPEDLLRIADEHMYANKRRRDRAQRRAG
ncbi:GGDEF domain-containing protein [Streptomyces sp. SID3343]|uniref:GGDEF domain-containing protein n=1 Tax=Streptomyces sp. SID3343 TaxID=2690260 RepID=UPI0013703DBC|nr:GGDEF domain-containing protein [Streptomyces sp. SID3343]MYW06556.1 diguanylate cyclase [Streptomyces sp. SID3343]